MNIFKTPKVSIAVTIYNREEYIRECLDSILSQNIDKEIICTDDCSTDSTYEILQEYKKKYKEIKLYQNEKHLGSSLTMSNGLFHCHGEYMLFVDADDKLLPNTLDKIYKQAKDTCADVLEFILETDGNKTYSKYSSNCKEILEGGLLDRYLEGKIANTLCNKLVHKKVYKKVVKKIDFNFHQSNYNDQFFHLSHVLFNAHRFVYCDIHGYFYYTKRGMTANISNKERVKILSTFKTTIRELEQVYGKSKYLRDNWNITCNVAVETWLGLSPNEQEETKCFLEELMGTKNMNYLIEKKKNNIKIGT